MRYALILTVLAGAVPGHGETVLAQEAPQPVLVSQADARTHVVEGVAPAYPAGAKASHVSGPVHLQIEVSREGRVTSITTLQASPMLEYAARDAVLRWRFRPFVVGGTAVAIRTTMSVLFASDAPDETARARLSELGDSLLLCLENTRGRAFEVANLHCGEARTQAERLAPVGQDATLMRRLEANALLEIGRAGEALAGFDAVIEARRRVLGREAERGLAWRGRARALAALDQQADALEAFARADEELSAVRNAFPRESPKRAELLDALRSTLTEYAALLDTGGRGRDAERVRSRLKSLR